MKTALLTAMATLLSLTASAQTTFDTDFESGELSGGWSIEGPASPYTGGFTIVTYASETSLKAANVGTNDLGGTYVLKSLTGAKNKVKADSDNSFVSPEVTIGTDNILSFRLAANCSYSPTKEDAEKMKMDVVVIEGTNHTVIGTITPENYFSWKQYAFDLSAYNGKTIKVAFHDYGTAGSGAIGDMKYIDNIKLTSTKSSDYSIQAVTTLHGQAEFTTPFTVKISNYGMSKGSIKACYEYGSTKVSEDITTNIASGESMEYTFKKAPNFTPGDTVTFKTWVSGADDAISANDALDDQTIGACCVESLPYSVCSTVDEEGVWNDLIANEFSTATGSSYSKWTWGLNNNKYHAWIYSLTKATKAQLGYLYTNKAFILPAGTVYLQTVGTATLTDNSYEVYVAQYGGKDMVEYATKVGQSEVLRDVTETETVDTTTVQLTIPQAGTYVIAFRPMTTTLNAQMAIIGYSLTTAKPEPVAIHKVNNTATSVAKAYNIAGQRVSTSVPGIKIINGKKYVK